MPGKLTRYQHTGHLHFLTFSCHHRAPYLASEPARTLVQRSLETMRLRYHFNVVGYVVMPEHVHLLLSEPEEISLARAIQSLKLSVAVQQKQCPFWQARYYDFNVYTEPKRVEKLKYMHRNPVTRGFVDKPEDWQWSSFVTYSTGVCGAVDITTDWLEGWSCRREPQVSDARPGAPDPLQD